MARSRRSRQGILLNPLSNPQPEPEPEPEPEPKSKPKRKPKTVPTILPTLSWKPTQPGPSPETEMPTIFPARSSEPNQPGPKPVNYPEKRTMRRVWSKCDVIVMLKGMVDFMAQKGVDPMNNLDDFVDYINKNSSSSTGNVFNKITWQLRKVGDAENNYILHLETHNVGNNSSSNNNNMRKMNKGSVVGDKVSILGKNDGGVECSSIPNSVKKNYIVEKKMNLGDSDGGVSCFSIHNSVKKSSIGEKKVNCKENVGEMNCTSIVENMKKNKESSVGGEKSKSRTNYSGEKCTNTQKNLMKKNSVGVKKSRSGAMVRRKTKTVIPVGKKSTGKAKEDGGKKWSNNKNTGGESSILSAKKGGMKSNNGGCSSLCDFGFWDKNEGMLREAMRRMISRRLSLRDELQNDISWCPPTIGVLKWNTDASLRADDRMTAIGGVLRDWQGSFRCVFSCPVGCCDINEAEVRAIYKALELASCKDWLLSLNMVIESDSMNAVTWCNEDNGGPLNLGSILSYIRECRKWWPGLEITYMGRKSNSVADSLAKQGHQRSADFVAWM